MADKELGALSPIETLLAAALFHTVQQGNSRKVTAQHIADFVNGNYPAFIQTLLSAQSAEDIYEAIGAAPDADKLGGQLPSFFASTEAVATAFEQLTKADVDLGNVDNTADVDKPVSTAQQTALDLKVAGPVAPVTPGNLAQFTAVDGKTMGPATIGSPAFLGRFSAGVGDVERMTVAQARQNLGGWEFIGSFSLAGLSVLTLTGLGAYRSIKLSSNIVLNASGSAVVNFSADNGTTFGADADEFRYTILDCEYVFSGGTLGVIPRDGLNNALHFMSHGGDTGWPSVSELTVHDFNAAKNTAVLGNAGIGTTTNRFLRTQVHYHKRNTAQNALRVTLTTATTFQHGFVSVQGIRG